MKPTTSALPTTVACFQYRQDARAFREALGGRLEKFRLALAEEKTRCIEFGRFARENARRRGGKPGEFTFLGFTHYCGKTKKGHFKLKRRTSRKKVGCRKILKIDPRVLILVIGLIKTTIRESQ